MCVGGVCIEREITIEYSLPLHHQGSLFSACIGVKRLSVSAGDIRDTGLIPGSGRFPGGGSGNPLQYSYLENPMDREAWWDSSSIGSHRVGHD